MKKPISVQVINLAHRVDRREHIIEQFRDKKEFLLTIVPAIENKKGALGLWKTVQKIVLSESKKEDDFFILCEDDHAFTQDYSFELLEECIIQARERKVQLLSGGYSWFANAIQISKNLFWVDKFNGMQFTVVFRPFYDEILSANVDENVITDLFLSSIAENKYVIYPYISIQKEFGYSDVTTTNNKKGYVDGLFKFAESSLGVLNKVLNYYNNLNAEEVSIQNEEINNIKIPTYIINKKERIDRLRCVKKQFEDRSEFDIHIVEACEHKVGRIGLWNSFVKIIQLAIQNDEDVIIICEDDHTFTEHYDKYLFIRNIIEASKQNVEILNGGVGGFGRAIPLALNRYWIDWFWCNQFSVYYRPIFKKILEYNFQEFDTADGVFSEITSHKMAIYPFLSTQIDFGYSDVTLTNDKVRGKIIEHFREADEKMNMYHQVNLKYLIHNK